MVCTHLDLNIFFVLRFFNLICHDYHERKTILPISNNSVSYRGAESKRNLLKMQPNKPKHIFEHEVLISSRSLNNSKW